MKKMNGMFCAFAILTLALAFAGCKTAPASTESGPETTADAVTDTKPVDEALTALRDKTESLRAECLKYHLDSYMVNEWADAEALRAAGLEAYGVNYDLSKKSFEDALAKYEEIRKASYAKIAAELDASLTAAREKAIAVGASGYYPEQFALADAAAAESREKREAGDDGAAYEAAQKALLRYQTLIKGMEAVALKQKITENNFVQYGAEDFALAESKYSDATAAYGSADAAALDSMAESVRLYEKVNNAGYKVLCEGAIAKADEIRALCDSIKASKSVKDGYAKAAVLYKEGAGSASSNSWEAAYGSYTAASVSFAEVYQAATLKKNSADAAIAAAKDRQEASTKLAQKADEIAPLPENAEGYSDEPVLIEGSAPTEEPSVSDVPATSEEPVAVEEPAIAEEPAPIEEPAAAEEPAPNEAPAVIEDTVSVEETK